MEELGTHETEVERRVGGAGIKGEGKDHRILKKKGQNPLDKDVRLLFQIKRGQEGAKTIYSTGGAEKLGGGRGRPFVRHKEGIEKDPLK